MNITQKIAAYAKPRAEDLQLADVCLGLGYTGVKLSNGAGGVSYTFRDRLSSGCGVMAGAGGLIGTPAAEVLEWASSDDLAKASLGVATINALLNGAYEAGPNIVDAVTCEPEDVIGMVGAFCPLFGRFREAARLYVFEQDPAAAARGGNMQVLPEEAEEELLPSCDQVILTGTSFINHTVDRILELCKNAREIIIVGASTPMCGEVLRPYGVTVLAGSRVTDADAALRIIAQGGGTMDLSRVTLKLLERI